MIVVFFAFEMWESYFEKCKLEYKNYYMNNCINLNKEIFIISGQNKTLAYAFDIDESYRLVVRDETGEITHLDSGEISVRI